MIVQDGQVIGTWKRTIHNGYMDLYYNFFKPSEMLEKAFKKSVSALKEFIEMEIKLQA